MSRTVLIGLFLLSCLSCRGGIEHGGSVDFGDVLPGSARRRTMALRNTGGTPLELTLSVNAPEVMPEREAFIVPADATANIGLLWMPRVRGVLSGHVELRAGDDVTRLVLMGTSAAGEFSIVPSEVDLGLIPYVAGLSPPPVRVSLQVTNLGGIDEPLQFVANASGAACVGALDGDACAPWGPGPIAEGGHAELPVWLVPTAAGAQAAVIEVREGWGRAPARTATVTARLEPIDACAWAMAQPFSLIDSRGQTTLTHLGPGRCLVTDLVLESEPTGAFEFSPRVPLPVLLEPGASLTLAVRVAGAQQLAAEGVLRATPWRGDVLRIPFR